jgi:XRE family transcriptional regulator, aerobic/anaerobic benzoate catabolism transcriptional regulator
MSSTTVHRAEASDAGDGSDKNPFLVALGERLRSLRARRGMTRKALAGAADVSERHLANLEYGIGNASILVLVQVAGALQCTLAELLGDVTTATPEWLLIRELLEGRDDPTLRRVRSAITQALGDHQGRAAPGQRHARIALLGLRGAGKSTLGAMLGESLGVPFVELGREIERLAGCSEAEIQALYGQNAYRRYERRALEETIRAHDDCVLATAGGIVSDAATFNLLLSQCTTVWLAATPEDHMRRVIEQGDMRPMGANNRDAMKEAMNDLRSILAGRKAFYSKADFTVDTSAQDLPATFERLRVAVMKSRVPVLVAEAVG